MTRRDNRCNKKLENVLNKEQGLDQDANPPPKEKKKNDEEKKNDEDKQEEEDSASSVKEI